MTDLPYLASRLYGTPLLIARPKLEVILGVVARKMAGDTLATPPPANVDASMTNSLQNLEGIAILPVLGTLVRRSSYIGAASGLTSYHDIEAMAEAAFADPMVKAVLLEIDSSGGEAGGVFDLAQRLRSLAQTSGKPLWAIADEAALSAAYAIACAADRLWLTRTAEVGSIGVVAVHVDESVADAKAGMTYTFLHAGAHKVDGHPHAPLPAPVAADIQADIEQLHEQFISLVAGFRRLKVEAIRDTEARVYRGEAALQAGLADQIGTRNEAVTALQRQLAMSAGRSLRNKAAALSATRTTSRSQPFPKEISMNDHNPVTPVDDTQENSTPNSSSTPTQSPQIPPPLDEAATFVAAPIVAVDEEGTPASHYDVEIVGPRPKIIGMEVAQDETGLVIAVPLVITGLYPPVEIEYQTPLPGGGRQTGFSWDFPEIPVEADEIICFTPRKEPSLDWTLRVTAYFAQGSDSAEFVLRVRADWTPGRDALKEAVDARRHPTRQ